MNKKINVDDLIPLSEASNICGLTSGHLNYLVRNNKLRGIKLGRNWFTTREALENYLKTNRKSGPKKST